ncbi:MAG: hypothetical protein JNK84_14470 [Phreatobacter sp.]|uniref:DUF5681 domain-containing protein n=1 Tax=Phreatobacter sp. TaxID=1966341 RepID=UPI001A4A034D|nr:DUF5681 domain-containing protein [Phreatobacter sp.]MBL8570270.1 hypothetical protein [Phreatobacter sp.]
MAKKDKPPEPEEPKGDQDEAVGYCRPPRAHQFKPGESGNKSGRPKRQAPVVSKLEQRHRQLVLDELYRLVPIKEGDKTVRVPALAAMVRGQWAAGIKGSRLSAKLMIDLIKEIERESAAAQAELVKTLVDMKQKGMAKQRAAQRAGEPEPDFDIYPEDISIDMETGEATFRDPAIRKLDEQYSRITEEVEAAGKRLKKAPKDKKLQLQLKLEIERLEGQRELVSERYMKLLLQEEENCRKRQA